MEIILAFLKKLNLVPVPLLDGQMQVVKARALMEANKAGVFHAIGEGSLTMSEIAKKIQFSEVGMDVLLKALVSINYLKVKNGRYSNGRWVKHWILDPERSLHHMLILQMYTYKRLEELGLNLKSGVPEMNHHAQVDVAKADPSLQGTYTYGMREAARLIIPDLLKRVTVPSGAKRMLDIGGAHGEYCRQFVRKFPGLKATVFDLAGPVTVAKKIMEKEGNPDDIDLRVGNCLEEDFGNGWDVILLCNMVHLFDVATNLALFKRCKAALAPGGTLLCVDQFVGISGQRDRVFAVVSLNFFNVGGKSYEAPQMKELLAQAGFPRVEVKPLGLRTPASLIQAHV